MVICLKCGVYNPWSVIKFLYDLYSDVNAVPRPTGSNTSSNYIIRELIALATGKQKEVRALLKEKHGHFRCMRRLTTRTSMTAAK